MYVHRSNRIEVLAGVLADLVAEPPDDAFARECIVVQGRGMERWLSMELARRLGVWANPDFPFPRAIIDRALAGVLGDEEPITSPFEPGALMWAIADLLPSYLEHAEFAPVRAYLDRDPRRLKLIELAALLADTFDHYAVYRPDMVLGWDAGEGKDWQAVLWRGLVHRHGPGHAAAKARALQRELGAGRPLAADFPARVSVFGVSTLPPLYVDVLAMLSEVVELHLFLLSPSREYWGDIRSRREKIRELTRRRASSAEALEALHLPDAPALLESLGRVGRDFQHVLEGAVDYEDDPRDLYVDPGTSTMLAALQSDLLWLRTRAPGDPEAPPLALPSGDDSVVIHACHGPMREVEVLHDQLVAAFDRDRSLQLHDVVVMAPAIDAYAPFIEAVFGSAHRLRIPFRIADRSARAANEVLEAFIAVIDVVRGRFPASAVLDLIALSPVRERFGIGADEIDTIRSWIAEAGVRWGVDETHRRATGQPACRDHTWSFGLDRLLLGYALPVREEALYRGVLPYDDVEGADAVLLGRLAECCQRLFDLRSLLDARPLARWRDDLSALLAGMVAANPGNAHQHEEIRRALAALAERAERAGFTGPVDLETVRVQIEREVEGGRSPRGFLSGGVTFCELVPMRSIPFRIVCLLGLNSDAFPRSRRPPGFDLIAQQPRIGDRNPRDDDRYLFLEALLSARERLIITFTGRSISDNTELPPSVVVSELIDAIDRTYAAEEATGDREASNQQLSLPLDDRSATGARAESFTGAPARTGTRVSDRVVVRHPLQPFSPSYFDGSVPALFSYAPREHDAARALIAERHSPPPFLSAPLPHAEPIETVALDDLTAFFEHPSRRFLQRCLGLTLRQRDDTIDDREPITLDSLARWRLGDRLLRRALRGDSLAGVFPLVRAGGELPQGRLGRCTYDAIAPEVEAIAATTLAARGGARAAPLEIDLMIEGVRLTGILRNVWPLGQVAAQFSRLGRRHELGHWIRHLVFNATRGRARTLLIGRGKNGGDAPGSVSWRPVADPQRQLASLLDLYRIGQRYPLPLFQRASRAYAEEMRRGGNTEQALASAARHWTDFMGLGDGDDPHVERLYGRRPPFAAETPPGVPSFAEVARRVYDPFFAHLEEPPE
jgi:exodeoxyribonuclease V gamma subunit